MGKQVVSYTQKKHPKMDTRMAHRNGTDSKALTSVARLGTSKNRHVSLYEEVMRVADIERRYIGKTPPRTKSNL